MDKAFRHSYRPNGYYLLTHDWEEAVRAGLMTQPIYLECYPEHTIVRQEPKSLEESIHWKFCIEREHLTPAAFVAFLPGGRVWGANGVVITPDNKLLADVSIEFNKRPEQHAIFTSEKFRQPIFTTENVCVLGSVGGWNYYHWMFDILPRIHLLRKSGIPAKYYAINNLARPFQWETLQTVGISRAELFLLNDRSHLISSGLVVPSLPGHSGHMPKWVCEFLRLNFLSPSGSGAKGYERIYISRTKAGYRKVLNEPAVIQTLREYGFQIALLEDLTVADQARLFASAEVVVTPHGAGLTNLVFCRPGTKVIEIFSPNYVNVLYWALSNQMQLDYYYLLGIGERPPENVDPHAVMSDIYIDNDSLRYLLYLAGIRKD